MRKRILGPSAPGVVPYSILQKAIDFIDAVQTREEQGGLTS